MKAFTEPLLSLAGFEEMTKTAEKSSGLISVTGCIDAQKSQMIYAFGGHRKNKLIVTFGEQKAKELYDEYSFFDKEVVYYPSKDVLFYQSDIRGNLLTAERIRALKAIREQERVTLVTTFDALMNTMAPIEKMWENVLTLEQGQLLDLKEIQAALIRMGYEKEYQVQTMGQFSVRGGILDVFPLTEENPIRIELWGDEIDTIRYFDCESQKSIENTDRVSIYPAAEIVLSDEEKAGGIEKLKAEAKRVSDKLRKQMKTEEAHRVTVMADELTEEWGELSMYAGMDAFLSYFFDERVGLLDYFKPSDSLIFFDELTRCTEQGKLTETEFSESMKQRLAMGYILPGQMNGLFTEKEIVAKLGKYSCIALGALDNKANGLHQLGSYGIHCQSVSPYNNSFELLIKDLKRYKKNGYRVILLSGSRTRAKRLSEDITDQGITCFYTENYDHELFEGQIMVCYGKVRRGFEYPILKFAVITESDIFGAQQKKKKRHRTYEGEKIQSFTDLSVGDYVVHENHGLGIYRGIEKLEVDKKVKDYIKIEYQGGSNLYILATQLDMIQKYAGKDARKPKLNKLGGQEWTRTKNRVRGAVKQIAGDLVKLYAQREQQNGYAFGEDTVWQREFEELFPFDETEDQILAIEATKTDMQSHKIMDRLICGDVGYGKTEVALRAAMKCILDGKQVALLVPTTVLAQQHYATAAARFRAFPVTVEVLSRFRTPKQVKDVLERVKDGRVDLLIGTHKLLGKGVQFKDLGLLIIDEEQRFGVTHKERLRQVARQVDTLTLSATPIPRTLNMAMSGIRDMSTIEQPPQDRQSVQTYVLEHDWGLLADAIRRELGRGGQVYYLHNRVDSIDATAAHLRDLLGEDVAIETAHGKMAEGQLSDVMARMSEGEIDVLVCTTIIETGIDIPNVNTLIIEDADNMGLSQLHQLRGRIGRSPRRAYAYLTYRAGKVLTEVAAKRLTAIREYVEFGSGFKIAMRDLEIRGAGNLLGPEQSGYMMSVGYDMYLKLLNDAVLEQQGKTAPTRVECSADITVAAYIPESYVPAARQRMDLYRRIAALRTPEDESELTDELLDRYGDVPPPVTALLRVALLRAAAMDCGVTDITQKGRQLVFSFDDRVDPAALLAVCTMAAYRSRAQLSAGAAPRLTLYMQPGEEPLAAAGALVDALRLHQTDTQQMNGAQSPEEAKHEE